MDGYIVGSMISANSITGEQIQANSIKTANLELSVQKKIQDATNEETVKALIKADLDGFESTLSKEFVTVENATTQIQQATEVAVKEATQSIIDNAVSESMGAVDGQLNDKLNQYTGSTLLPAIAEKAEEVLQNAEDYVVTKLESYATKQELSSSISQTREQIELSVSEKYTTKTESATIITEAIDGITVGAINRALGTGENKSFKFNGGANETWLPYKFSNDISDKEVFVSFKYTLTGTAQNGSQIEFAPSYLKKTNNQTVYRPKHVFFTSDRLQDVNITDTVSFTTKDFQDISSSSTSYIRFVGNGFTGTLSVSEAQIKQGNSKTSWSPAPEDTITDITNAKNDAIGSANNTLIATIANYYTKSETDSAISVAKDEINLGVSNTYETKATVETKIGNIQVGGTNLVKNSPTLNNSYVELNTYKGTRTFVDDTTAKCGKYIKFECTTAGTGFYVHTWTGDDSCIGKKYTWSFYAKMNKAKTLNNIGHERGGIKNIAVTTEWQKFTHTWTYSSSGNRAFVFYPNFEVGDIFYIRDLKIEEGTRATDWTPCPSDVDNAISTAKNEAINSANNTLTTTIANYYTKEQTDSQINVAKDAINLGVSTNYETKANVETKVSSTLSSAKSYADAKKTEAINSAASDAASKVNAAKSELNTAIDKKANSTDVYKKAEVYTKSETDSKITIAKDEINLGVSNTYETKTNVTTKINGVNNSISSLTTRMTNAESKITDTAITNVVKQNFYTKEETNNQITSKGYQTASQVQQTVDQLQIKFTESGGYNLLRNGGFENGIAFWLKNNNPDITENQVWQNYHGKSIFISATAYGSGIYQHFSTVPGKIYSYSFYAQAEYGTWFAGVEHRHTQDIAVSPNDWRRYTGTFTATSNSHAFICYAYGNGRNVFLDNVIICEGSIPSAYTPHPSEIYDGITTIDKDGINVATSYGAHTQFHAGGMSSYNNSNQRTLGIENGGISFHSWNNNALAAYVTQSSLWGGDQSASGLAISTTKNGAYLALGTSSLSDVNTTLNMDQALTISANDSFQPRGINFWKDVHAHGYGIRQLSHLQLAGSGAIQFDYLNNSPSTIYEAVDNGHSLYVMGGYQMHLGVMEGSGSPHAVIWMRGKTDTHSYTHWDFHNYTMYNMKTASTYANYETRRISESYGVTSNVDGVRYVYRNVELVNGKAIRSIPLEYKGCEYDIVSIVCKGRGNAWVQDEDVDKFVIEGDCQSVNIEIIIHEIEQNLHTVALDEVYMEPLSQKIEPEIPTVITNVSPNTL